MLMLIIVDMSRLDDQWFRKVLESCYNNPREEREARRKMKSSSNQFYVPTEGVMVKPRKGGSTKGATDRSDEKKGGETRKGRKTSSKDNSPKSSTDTTNRKNTGAKSPQRYDFDVKYAVQQAHLMYKGKDDVRAARALFPTGSPEVNLDAIVKTAKSLNLRPSRQFLEYIGLVEEGDFVTPPAVARVNTTRRKTRSSPEQASGAASGDGTDSSTADANKDRSAKETDKAKPCAELSGTSLAISDAARVFCVTRDDDYEPPQPRHPADKKIDGDTWRDIWRDDMCPWDMAPRDARALERCSLGENFTFRLTLQKKDGEHTIHAMCGHVDSGPDFHLLCRACEMLATGLLCCSAPTKRCVVGDKLNETEKDYVSRVVASRKIFRDGVSHRGSYTHIEIAGVDPRLVSSTLARLCYALGAGASLLEPLIDDIIAHESQLGLKGGADTKNEWKERGVQEGVTGLMPRKILRVIAKNLMTEAGKGKLVGKEVAPSAAQVVEIPKTGSLRLSMEAEDTEFLEPPETTEPNVDDDQSSTRSTKRSASRDSALSGAKKARAQRQEDDQRYLKSLRKSVSKIGRSARSTFIKASAGSQAVGRELYRVEDTLCLHVACSDDATYSGSCTDARLQLNLDDDVPARIGARLDVRQGNTEIECGKLLLHHGVMSDIYRADELRCAELRSLSAVPPNTTNWDLASSTSRLFTDPGHTVSARPPTLPEVHIPGTPSTVQRDTLLPVAYEALTAQEQLCRSAVHEISAAREELSNVQAEVMYGSLTGTDGSTSRPAGNVFATLDAALGRCSRMIVDSMQAAIYHRRLALLSGASNEQKITHLRQPILGATNALGAVDQKITVKAEPVDLDKIPWHGETVVIDSSDSEDDSTTNKKGSTNQQKSAATKKVITHQSVGHTHSSPISYLPVVNQGSPSPSFGDISIENISPMSETKLIKTIADYLTFE